jgi:hypothetical protein
MQRKLSLVQLVLLSCVLVATHAFVASNTQNTRSEVGMADAEATEDTESMEGEAARNYIRAMLNVTDIEAAALLRQTVVEALRSEIPAQLLREAIAPPSKMTFRGDSDALRKPAWKCFLECSRFRACRAVTLLIADCHHPRGCRC